MSKKDKKLGLEPAFPMTNGQMADELVKFGQSPEGMSKRFYAACCAMRAMLSNPKWNDTLTIKRATAEEGVELTVIAAYLHADELLKQEYLYTNEYK